MTMYKPKRGDSALANQMRNIIAALINLDNQLGDKYLAIKEDVDSWIRLVRYDLECERGKNEGKKKQNRSSR